GSLVPLFNPNSTNTTTALLVQPDGKIVVAGSGIGFTTGNSIARFNPNGSRDTAFHPAANNSVNCLALQSDGKILVGGAFTMLAGQSRFYLGRLNTNGTLDAGFHPLVTGTPYLYTS